jgi:bacteriorhodopsin
MGNGATVFKRSAWDLALIAVCIVAFVIVEWLVAKLKRRVSNEAWWTLAILAPIAVLGLIMALFPSVGDPYPYGLSVPMVWNFRLMSLGNYALIWGTIGIGGGWLMRQLATSPSVEHWASPADQRLAVSAAAN